MKSPLLSQASNELIYIWCVLEGPAQLRRSLESIFNLFSSSADKESLEVYKLCLEYSLSRFRNNFWFFRFNLFLF